MNDRTLRLTCRYETSLDRAGLALAVGALLTGALALVLVAAAGQRDPFQLAALALLSTLFAAIAIIAVAGPLWLALHLAGLRRPRHAALSGALVALLLCVSGQTYGFGLLAMPAMDGQALSYRWISAVAMGLVAALIAALVGVAMWRVAYRRVKP